MKISRLGEAPDYRFSLANERTFLAWIRMLNQPLSAIRHYAQGCLIRLRAADEQHPLLPALEQIDQQAQRG
ncbi:DUF202 domain-containing protein, partial [Salmonella enterica subsp. enterica serovar Montevideo]|nr:DUF202 domain-containing protein [Salmonella enterica subsp. enterica serovar Montevideo]